MKMNMAKAADLPGYTGTIDRIHTEAFFPNIPFVEIAERFSEVDGTVVLMSGGDGDGARYHILAVNPWLTIKSRNAENSITFDDNAIVVDANPLDLLKLIAGKYKISGDGLPEPVAAGLFGYLSYDLKDYIEKLPKTTVDDLCLPHLYMNAPSAIFVEDRVTGKRHLHISVRKKGKTDSCQNDRKAFFDRLDGPRPGISEHPGKSGFSTDHKGFKSSFLRNTYMAGVEKIRDYIVSGDIYQVNLSQRFCGEFSGSSFEMFKVLFEKNPAPFYAYVNAGDHRIVSTSPERFLKQSGRIVESRPIKGTRPRGETEDQDRANAEILLKSPKDDAELSMIVDLVRNDLGRVCAGGSVKVSAHRRLESYRNVFHLVSVIEGRLADGKDSVDLIRAAFPGGSITGCPRIRAMEIIDELEPCRRHIYTGSIGYIGFHETMDLSIAIRTATITNGRIYFSVGGGVVFDSVASDEYDETLHKGKTLMGVFKKEDSGSGANGGLNDKGAPMVWFNGALVPAEDVRFNAADKGVMYGYGFFETIRASRGRPGYLTEHIDRFNRAWEELFKTQVPDFTWTEIIRQVILENQLENSLSTVKIMAACRDDGEKGDFSANIVVTAVPGRHRLDLLGKMGIDLAIYPYSRESPLADYKTLNYLYYYLAGKWARENGADEAVILNADATVSETNTANILCLRGSDVIVPLSGHVLPGIMESQVTAYLLSNGWQIVKQKIAPEDLAGFDAILLTNSLMGAVPVIGIDGVPIRSDPGLCLKINKAVL